MFLVQIDGVSLGREKAPSVLNAPLHLAADSCYIHYQRYPGDYSEIHLKGALNVRQCHIDITSRITSIIILHLPPVITELC